MSTEPDPRSDAERIEDFLRELCAERGIVVGWHLIVEVQSIEGDDRFFGTYGPRDQYGWDRLGLLHFAINEEQQRFDPGGDR